MKSHRRKSSLKLLLIESLEDRRLLAGNGPPFVQSITRIDANPTNLNQVAFRVLFDEAVQASTVDAADFAITKTGITGESVSSVTGTGDTYTVLVNTGAGSGTLRLDVIDDNTIRDLSGDRLGGNGPNNGNFTSGQLYDIDKTAPQAVSLNRSSSNPTSSSSVTYALQFSEAVNGVDSSDFDLITTGVSGYSVASVSGSGLSYTITVNTGSGDGTIQLRLLDDNSIVDVVGNALVGVSGNDGQLAGQMYTIARPPVVNQIQPIGPTLTNSASVSFLVQFSESVTSVDLSDFVVQTTGAIVGASVTSVAGSGSEWTVNVNTGSGEGTIGLTVLETSIFDLTGNRLLQSFVSGPLFTIDKSAPTVSGIVQLDPSPTNQGSVRYRVSFSEPVSSVSAADFSIATTVTGALINGFANLNSQQTDVFISTGTGSGSISLNVLTANQILDLAGNPMTVGSTSSAPYVIDRVAPTLQSITLTDPNPNSLATVSYQLQFSENVVGLSTANFSPIATGLTGSSVLSLSGSGSIYTVSLASGSGQGTLRLGYTISVTDLAGNALSTSGNSNAYNIDLAVPQVVSITPVVQGPTASDRVYFDVVFSEFVSGLDTSDFVVVSSGVSGAFVSTITGFSSNFRVGVVTGSGDGLIQLKVSDNDSIRDAANNPLGGIGLSNGDFTSATGTTIKKSVDVKGTLWDDVNSDGTIDASEARWSGVQVYLDLNGNNLWDASTEPGQLTDVAGNYLFPNLAPNTYTVAAIYDTTLLQTYPAKNGPGRLKLQDFGDGVGASHIATTPDSRFVYVARNNQIETYRINSTSGQSEFVQALSSYLNVSRLLVSPDGKNLYVSKTSSGAIFVLSINSSTGQLAQVQVTSSSRFGQAYFVSSLSISADGASVFATGSGIEIFSRNLTSGILGYSASYIDSLNFIDSSVSPDNNHVYALWSGGIYVFQRSSMTSPIQTITHQDAMFGPDYSILNSPEKVVVSPDGQFVYVSSSFGSGITVFSRQANGTLSFVQAVPDGLNGAELLQRTIDLKFSPDAKRLYVVGQNDNALTVLSRNSTTGKLSFFEAVSETATEYPNLTSPNAVAATADGRFVLVSSIQDGVSVFEIGKGTLDPLKQTQVFRPGNFEQTANIGLTVLPPTPLSISTLGSNPTAQNSATFSVQFNKPVTGVDSSDFSLSVTGVTGAVIQSVTGSGQSYEVVVGTGVGSGSLSLQLDDNDSIVDALGNPLMGAGTSSNVISSSPLTIDKASPGVASMTLPSALYSRTVTSQIFVVNFSEPVAGVDVADFTAITTGTLTPGSIASVTGSGAVYTVTVNVVGSGAGTIGLRLVDNDSIVDVAGNKLGGEGVDNGSFTSTNVYTREFAASSSISGKKWNDLNGNGAFEIGEPALAGWTIFVDSNKNGVFDIGEQSAVTNVDGLYSISGIFSGDYLLGEVMQPGWEQTSPGLANYPITLVSRTATGGLSGGSSDKPSLSSDGRFMAFQSSGILTAGDTSTQDIFVRDNQTGTLEKISVGLFGANANNLSYEPSISVDGRYVVYQSYASNLVSGDTNSNGDIFLYDRQTQTTRLVTEGGNQLSDNPSISADGRYVVFESSASNLVAGDTNSASDVFLWDRDATTSSITRISGGTVQSNGASTRPSISANGNWIAYQSTASNLVLSDTNGAADVFLYDVSSNTTTRVSRTSGGIQGNSSSFDGVISGDGRFVAYWSNASNLSAFDNNSSPDTFLFDRINNTVESISLNSNNSLTGTASQPPAVSHDGRFVVFGSSTYDSGSNGLFYVYVRDRNTGESRRISQSSLGAAPDSNSYFYTISSDGSQLALGSDARNLVAGDTNFSRDIFSVSNSLWKSGERSISLAINQSLSNQDFGNQVLAGDLRGTAWQDLSRNGTRQSPSEPGIVNRQVYVDLNSNNSFDSGEPTTTTDSLGAYVLSGLASSTYAVREILPANWTEYAPANGSHSVVVGTEKQVTLDFEGTNANLTTTYTKDGFSLTTSAGNSLQWEVYSPTTTPATPTIQFVPMDMAAVPTLQRTDLQPFSITSIDLRQFVSAGTSYVVTFVGERVNGTSISQSLSVGNSLTTYPLTGFNNLRTLHWYTNKTRDVAIDNIQLRTTVWDYTGLDFGSMGNPGVIQGEVYYDSDQNGVKGLNEAGVASRTFYLDYNNNNIREVSEPLAQSNATGQFSFSGINPGQHWLRLLSESNWTQSQPASNGYLVDLQPGQTAGGHVFGVWATPGSIRGTKWADNNANGSRDPGELGLANWTIYLDLNSNASLDSGEPFALTQSDNPATPQDELGTYELTVAVPGSYQVREVMQSGWAQTSPANYSSSMERSLFGANFSAIDLSDDGRFIVFQSTTAFVASDTNQIQDVYLFDRWSDTYELISVSTSGGAGNGSSSDPLVSQDGRYVAFRSLASNLYLGDNNGSEDIFIRDRLTNTLVYLTMPVGAIRVLAMSLTADGQQVGFSTSGDLLPSDTSSSIDAYVFHRQSGLIERLSLIGSGNVGATDLSSTGRYFAYDTTSTNQGIAGDTNQVRDVFYLDRNNEGLFAVSRTASGVWGNGASSDPSVSEDGRWVAFTSSASNFTSHPFTGGPNVFLKDMISGEIRLISTTYTGAAASSSGSPEISADGRWIVFQSQSQTMFPDSANSFDNIVLYDRLTDSLSRLSQSSSGTKGNSSSNNPNINRSGSTILFGTSATNIHPSGSGVLTIDRSLILNGNNSIAVSVAAGSTISGKDFGNAPATASISGTKFDDIDANGVRDVGEPGMSGISVYLDLNNNGTRDTNEPLTATDINGQYMFGNLIGSTYVVRSELPINRTHTIPSSAKRLFGTFLSPSGNLNYLGISEFSPTTGAVLNTVVTPIQANAFLGSAFDGQNILVLNILAQAIYELRSDGTVADQSPLPNANATYPGLAYIGGLAYYITFISSWPHLVAFDPRTNQRVRTVPLTHSLDGYGAASFPGIGAGLGESVDGKHLILTAQDVTGSDPRVLKIDPFSGRVVDHATLMSPNGYAADHGVTSLAGETYYSVSGQVHVYDGNFQFNRTLATPQTFFGLAGGDVLASSMSITAQNGQAVSNQHIGSKIRGGRLTGHLFQDFNDNGVQDANEPDLSNVRIYVDANQNFQFDSGELNTLTNASGNYEIDNVPVGRHYLRTLPPAGLEVSLPANQQIRSFSLKVSNNQANILEFDNVSGLIIRQFPAPGGVTTASGLAYGGNELFIVDSVSARVYVVNPDTQVVRGWLQLPSGVYDGLAFVGGYLYVANNGLDSIIEVDPANLFVLRTLDINSLNPDYLGIGTRIDMAFSLGESADGQSIMVQGINPNNVYLVSPITGQILSSQSFGFTGLASAGGEILTLSYSSSTLRAYNSQYELVRQMEAPADALINSVALAAGSSNTRGHLVDVALWQVLDLDFALTDVAPPSDIVLDNSLVLEKVPLNTLVGQLSAVDLNANDQHVFALVGGPGSTDNASFVITANQLRTNTALDYRVKSSYAIRVRVTDSAGHAFEKALTITVQNIPELLSPIQVGNGNQRSTVDRMIVDLDGPVDIDAGAFIVSKRIRDSQGNLLLENVDVDWTIEPLTGGGTRVILHFIGSHTRPRVLTQLARALVDGNFQLTIVGEKIRTSGTTIQFDGNQNGTPGGNLVFGENPLDKFYAFYGDYDGDRIVGVFDFARFRLTYGKSTTSAGFDPIFDFDSDGIVGIADFAQFRLRYGTSLLFS